MSIYYQDDSIVLRHGDSLETLRELPDQSVNCIVTSPPYFGLRDYGEDGQIGAEDTPAQYVSTLVQVFREARRVLADDGTFWLNLGDSYSSGAGGRPGAGSGMLTGGRRVISEQAKSKGRGDRPHKSLLGIPWRVAFALQDDGWILRNEIIWSKPNAMPESVRDRLSNRHEHLFMFTKLPRYWFDLNPVREAILHPDKTGHTFGGYHTDVGRRRGGKYQPADKARPATGERHTGGHGGGRNPGDVWEISTQPFPGAHFAVFPQEIPRRCIAAGCKPGGVVLDPFSGSGTTGAAASILGRKYVGVDLNSEYLDLSLRTRLQNGTLDFGGAA